MSKDSFTLKCSTFTETVIFYTGIIKSSLSQVLAINQLLHLLVITDIGFIGEND